MSKILFPHVSDLEAVELLLLTVNYSLDYKQYSLFKTSVETRILAVHYGQLPARHNLLVSEVMG